MRGFWFVLVLFLLIDFPVFGDTSKSAATTGAEMQSARQTAKQAVPLWQTSGPMNGRLYDALPLGRRDSLRLKCFAPQVSKILILCVLGGANSRKERLETEKREKMQRTLTCWLKERNKSSFHDPIFKDGAVSYIVSFDEKSDVEICGYRRAALMLPIKERLE